MDRQDYLRYVNGSGKEVILSSPEITKWFELRGRTGFTAPNIKLITQTYANGVTKVLKRQLEPRPVTISMMVVGDDEEERDSIFFDMISKLMDVDGEDTGRLYVKRSDGMIVYLNCTYSSGLSVFEQYRRYQSFNLEFYAPDAWFYKDLDDVTIETEKENYLTLSDTLMIGEYHKIGEFYSNGQGIIHNDVMESLQPVIRLQKAVGTMTITNETTGYSIKLKNMDMVEGQTLVIDTRDDSKNIYIVDSDGTESQAGQNLEWSTQDYEFPIVPGDNLITYNGGAGSVVEWLNFSMSERFLSA